jgi:integrase
MNSWYAKNHVLPAIGARKLRDLSVEDVDGWLASKRDVLGTRSLKIVHSILNRSVKNAMRRDKVKRNVVDLCDAPEGRAGRPSKALTLNQAESVLKAADDAAVRIRAYIVLSLLTGARTEELRELSWSHVVAFDETAQTWSSVRDVGWNHRQFAVYVWRSVRKSGDTKTVKSRRSLQLPARCVHVLIALKAAQARANSPAGEKDLVFRTRTGTALSAGNVRRDIRAVLDDAGLVGREWMPRELRHSFVSLLSEHRIPIEDISRLVGHTNTVVTETVYRKQIRPRHPGGRDCDERDLPASTRPRRRSEDGDGLPADPQSGIGVRSHPVRHSCPVSVIRGRAFRLLRGGGGQRRGRTADLPLFSPRYPCGDARSGRKIGCGCCPLTPITP